MISWGLCALPSAAGFAGAHSLCRVWRVCDWWACIWKCHHKNTPTFPKASLRLWLHWSSLTEHSVHCLIPSSVWIQTFWMFVCITRCLYHQMFPCWCCQFPKAPECKCKGWMVLSSEEVQWHLGPRALFLCLESCLLFCFGSYHFGLALGTWTLFEQQ